MPTSQLSRDEIHRNLDSFRSHWLKELEEWKAEGLTGEEQKSAQRFWIDLFSCFGITAQRMNLFERNARRGNTGNTGRIDLFYPGVVIGEAKKPGVDLEVAYQQVLDYLNGGSIREFEYPRYILCSNFEQFRLIRLGDTSFDVTFELSDVVDYLDSLKFLAGYDTVTRAEEARASIQASRLMAELFTAMAGDDVDEAVGDEAPTNFHDEELRVHETSMYLTRLLFLLFGDDAGLWEADLFTRFVEENTTPENLGPQLNALFEVLNTPENRRRHVPDSMAAFPYVNGAIFAEPMRTQYFTPAMRTALLHACRFNWSEISPAIFGSLFQLVKSKEARRSDGEHYTSEKNILKTLEPLFLTELREKAERLISAKSTSVKDLRAFRDSLADYAFLDPACGSGNFLIVAYRELRKIETELIVAIRRKEGTLDDMALDVSFEQKLSIGQFYGIEFNWWPARIAETAMFLVDHQANKELAQRIGAAPERLPISITAHIHHANALSVDWSLVVPEPKSETFVFGNPPFSGHKERSPEQGKDLKRAWGRTSIGHLDLVTGWFVLAVKFLGTRKGEFAFVATNSISQGESVQPLHEMYSKHGWKIKFAHRPFVWDSEAPGKAAVHCVIVGYTKENDARISLFEEGQNVTHPREISPYLIEGPSSLAVKATRKVLSPELAPIKAGSTPIDWDNLVVTKGEYEEVQKDPVMAKYLRPYIGGDELINKLPRWCLWLAESETVSEDIAKSDKLRARIEKVAEKRASSRREATQKLQNTPYLFGEIRQPSVDYLAIPQSFTERRKYATAARLTADNIASVKLFTVEDESGLLFAIISSSMFILWQKTVGGRIKSDPSFSSSLVWNTFPVPELTEKQRASIIKAGEKVFAARSLHSERSLAEHYNPLAMTPELVKAHDALDREVDKAFGASRKLSNERQRLELLLENYQALTEEA